MCARWSSPCTVPGGEGLIDGGVSLSARAAARMPPFLQRPSLCLARNCLTVRQFGPLESIDPNDAMILPLVFRSDTKRLGGLVRRPSFLSFRVTTTTSKPTCLRRRLQHTQLGTE